MVLSSRALKALVALLPLGALGISAVLAAASAEPITTPQRDAAANAENVAERLQAIRRAVSQATALQHGLTEGDPNIVKAWWGNFRPGGGWRNGGWGWRNGGWGWRNGGWHNGAWRNGGWPNRWGNGWR